MVLPARASAPCDRIAVSFAIFAAMSLASLIAAAKSLASLIAADEKAVSDLWGVEAAFAGTAAAASAGLTYTSEVIGADVSKLYTVVRL